MENCVRSRKLVHHPKFYGENDTSKILMEFSIAPGGITPTSPYRFSAQNA